MVEYDLFTRILSRDFLSSDQHKMEEPKRAGVHTCVILDTGIDHYKAYRYDLEERNFLPFFNNKHNDERRGIEAENPTPIGLLKFCDYILLAAVSDKLYVILVEMKSGNNAGANQQLDASRTFIDYVKASAERIKALCGCNDFKSKNIILRKVLLKPAPKTRPATNIRKNNYQIDFGAEPIIVKSQVFPLRKVCECHHR